MGANQNRLDAIAFLAIKPINADNANDFALWEAELADALVLA